MYSGQNRTYRLGGLGWMSSQSIANKSSCVVLEEESQYTNGEPPGVGVAVLFFRVG